MSNLPETPNPAESSAPDTPAAPAAPSFVPVDEFKQWQATIMGTMDTLNAGLQAINASLAQRRDDRPAPSGPVISEDDYAKALVEGDTKTISAYVRQEKARSAEALETFKRDNIDSLRTQGLTSIANLTAEVSGSKLPYFKRFEKEIRQKVAGLPPEQQANPQVWEIAHDAVVGSHAKTLLSEQKEEILRSASKPGSQEPGDGAGRMKDDKNRVPTVKELLGDDAVSALDSRGLTPDEWSKRLGYKGGWAEYAKLIKEQREGANV